MYFRKADKSPSLSLDSDCRLQYKGQYSVMGSEYHLAACFTGTASPIAQGLTCEPIKKIFCYYGSRNFSTVFLKFCYCPAGGP